MHFIEHATQRLMYKYYNIMCTNSKWLPKPIEVRILMTNTQIIFISVFLYLLTKANVEADRNTGNNKYKIEYVGNVGTPPECESTFKYYISSIIIITPACVY